jgi:hypothetical protein
MNNIKKSFIQHSNLSTKSMILIVVFALLIFSCNSSQENGENATNIRSDVDQIALNAWEKSGELVQKITLSPKGIVRNQSWGISIDSLNEKIELAENQPTNGKSYTLYFDDSDLNFTDITYLSDTENKLTEIDFDIFVETNPQVEEVKQKFTEYLQVKFGAPITQGSKIIWEKDKKTRVVLEDVSTNKDPGIKLVFSKMN